VTELLRIPATEYGELHRAHLFEQYKLYVESADQISQRRSSTNSFMLTVNAALVTLYGLTTPFKPAGVALWHLLVPVAGILVCTAWFSLVENYRSLNSVKFKVIHELEKQLPASLYAYEWELAERGEGKVYKPVTHIEQWIPIVFIALYVGLVAYPLLG